MSVGSYLEGTLVRGPLEAVEEGGLGALVYNETVGWRSGEFNGTSERAVKGD